MILPTKGIAPDQALITIGAMVLKHLDRPKTVSRLWDEVRRHDRKNAPLRFDWFVLALDVLYLLGAVELEHGRIRRASATRGEATT